MFLESDPGGVRTPNPQSRNLIFYPVELQGHFRLLRFLDLLDFINIVWKSKNLTCLTNLFYANNFFTIVEMVLPSAFPANSAATWPITLPIEAIPEAPVSAIIFATTASTSSSLN